MGAKEKQPGVEETVSWLNRPRGDEGPEVPMSTTIFVSEIAGIPDIDLRAALERQKDAQRKNLGYGVVAVAFWPDGQFSHSCVVPTRSLIDYAKQAHEG